MASYLLIDKNTMARESFVSLIYEMDKNAVAYESESVHDAVLLAHQFQEINFILLNTVYEQDSYHCLKEIKRFLPNSKTLIIVDEHCQIHPDSFQDIKIDSIITVKSGKNEVITAIKSMDSGVQYVSHNMLQTSRQLKENSLKVDMFSKNTKDLEKQDDLNMKLTSRQREVLDYITKGFANKLIAFELGVSEGTVKLHVSSILKALNVTNRTEAALRAREFMNSYPMAGVGAH